MTKVIKYPIFAKDIRIGDVIKFYLEDSALTLILDRTIYRSDMGGYKSFLKIMCLTTNRITEYTINNDKTVYLLRKKK